MSYLMASSRKQLRHLLPLLLLLPLLVGCHKAGQQEKETQAPRIVSLVPSVTDQIYDLACDSLLVGVMVSFMASSGVMLLLSVARAEQLSRIIFWTMGSLQESNPLIVWGMLLFTLLLLGVSYLFVQSLNALRLGELKAQQLGVDIRRVVLWLFVLSSLLTSACVSVAGVIGFVGLVIPQATRILLGNDYRVLLVGSFINGGIFLILCDMLARTILSPIELPIGVITGLIGGVAFLYLIHRTRRSHQI